MWYHVFVFYSCVSVADNRIPSFRRRIKRQRRYQHPALLSGDKRAQEKDGVSIDADTPHDGSRRQRGREQTRLQGHRSDSRPHRKFGDEHSNTSRDLRRWGPTSVPCVVGTSQGVEHHRLFIQNTVFFDGNQEQPSECRTCTTPT